ncbi:syntabulin isoform X1 [Salmo salar]|uniref:Syntabulin isoform X1 n=1 Tax=Salmo salar TaxID=8030 RepID=A0A1S3RTP0_SALSA|nr:syntabulin isoform X1 [Salmo salar]XP_045573645.1 syntabulin isoform X1 [Salmo salar]|eukprot:XP_014055643.1 PREDICTED: syntabulin isoform X1 [Salmo salar]
MGPFQEYEEKKSPGKESPRSRIPRLILHPFHPNVKGSPLSESPISEEEGKDCDISSDNSKRTISTNSFCSDDTGCPSSQSVSPSKTLSGSDNSPQGSPTPTAECKTKVKRVRVMAEWHAPPPRHKREQRSSTLPRGSEADFSSSSSTGSLKRGESLAQNSTGKKISSRRSLPMFKLTGSPSASHDAELYAPYRMIPSSSSSSSPTIPSSRANVISGLLPIRMTPRRYHTCGDNHGLRPPNPEQYLTPLQQKEVAIRHLRSKLREAENTVHDRESEIEELKSQLGRMREDWIEEECHRVEAQLALKEARKEIKQLRQVVETMKSSLMEKDKGIQKYFVDINIQNRKLECLLHSMEMAQSGSTLQDEPTMDLICGDSPFNDKQGEVGDQAVEEMEDGGLLVNDNLAHVLMSTAVDSSGKLRCHPEAGPGVSTLLHSLEEKIAPLPPPPSSNTFCYSTLPFPAPEEKAVQTEVLSFPPDLHALLLQLLKFHGGAVGDALLPASTSLLEIPAQQGPDLAPLPSTLSLPSPCQPIPVLPVSPYIFSNSGLCCSDPEVISMRFMEELDFEVSSEEPCRALEMAVVNKSYWSSSFLVDLVAVAVPVLPTVAWLYSRHGVDVAAPVYNIAALIRGCCIMGLHSLRHVTHRADV